MDTMSINSNFYTNNILLSEGYFYFGFLNKTKNDNFEIELEAKDINTNKLIIEYEGDIDISPYAYFYVNSNGVIIDAMTKTKSFTIYGNLQVDNLELDNETNINIIGSVIVKNNLKFTGINSFINVEKNGILSQLTPNAIIDTGPKFSKLQRDSRIDIKELGLGTVDASAKIKIKIEKNEPYIFVVPDVSPDSDNDDSDNDDSDSTPLITINELNIKPIKIKNTKEEIKNRGKVSIIFPQNIKIKFSILNFN
jgi:hypothetical protein